MLVSAVRLVERAFLALKQKLIKFILFLFDLWGIIYFALVKHPMPYRFLHFLQNTFEQCKFIFLQKKIQKRS